MNLKIFRRAFIVTLPVMAGYLVLGLGFGILLRVAGFGALWALAMSIFMYAGSMQYVGVSLLSGGASLVTVAVTTLMVQARHLFYGISLIDRYRGAGAKKLYLMHALTDETYSLVTSVHVPDFADEKSYYFAISLLNHLYWITGCMLGSLAGAILPFSSEGVDFAMTALFVTIFVEQWVTEKEHRPALAGAGCTLLCLLVFGSESFLIPAMALILLSLVLLRRPIEGKEAGQNG
jgi:4-azaleucine resistance transporter AzlC